MMPGFYLHMSAMEHPQASEPGAYYLGYEGSLAGQEVNPRNQFRSPPRKQEREDIGYEGSLAGQEVNPCNQFRSPP